MFGIQSPKADVRPSSKDGAKKNIWDTMLAEAARGKELPEKQLLILGGSPDNQRKLLEVLSPEVISSQYQRDRHRKRTVPISNRYALGYTYHDVLDSDQEDILARLSIYMLAEPSPAFSPLLKPLFTSKTIRNTLIVILLDWSDPHKWPRQLRQWIRLLRSVLITLDEETKIAMEENMTEWRERRRGIGPTTSNGTPHIPPSGPGEWDEGLGMPLCVMCQNAENIEVLEKESSWQEEDFDFVMQAMRTILLKHGSSMIYTSSFDSNSAKSLIHSSVGIHSTLKRETIKHNVVDRDKILIPPNWDSHGKIRIQREGFDPEEIGAAWSIDIQDPPEDPETTKSSPENLEQEEASNDTTLSQSAVAMYEKALQDPIKSSYLNPSAQRTREFEEVTSQDMQTFLSQQVEVLERLKSKDELEAQETNRKFIGSNAARDHLDESGRKMAEQIGPVQFNMGGIQVDADDMVKRLKDSAANRGTPSKPELPSSTTQNLPGTPDAKSQNEALASFFAGLMKNKGTGSPRTPSGNTG